MTFDPFEFGRISGMCFCSAEVALHAELLALRSWVSTYSPTSEGAAADTALGDPTVPLRVTGTCDWHCEPVSLGLRALISPPWSSTESALGAVGKGLPWDASIPVKGGMMKTRQDSPVSPLGSRHPVQNPAMWSTPYHCKAGLEGISNVGPPKVWRHLPQSEKLHKKVQSSTAWGERKMTDKSAELTRASTRGRTMSSSSPWEGTLQPASSQSLMCC